MFYKYRVEWIDTSYNAKGILHYRLIQPIKCIYEMLGRQTSWSEKIIWDHGWRGEFRESAEIGSVLGLWLHDQIDEANRIKAEQVKKYKFDF